MTDKKLLIEFGGPDVPAGDPWETVKVSRVAELELYVKQLTEQLEQANNRIAELDDDVINIVGLANILVSEFCDRFGEDDEPKAAEHQSNAAIETAMRVLSNG